MKKLFFLIAVLAITFSSCKEKNNDVIEKNIDTTFIGEWNIVKFAYTVDGNNISNEVIILNYTDSIVNVSYSVDFDLFIYFKTCNYAYSISGDKITYIQEKSSCWQVLVPWTNDEVEIANALRNVYKIVLKDNELMIYFTGSDDKNLLILKKQ